MKTTSMLVAFLALMLAPSLAFACQDCWPAVPAAVFNDAFTVTVALVFLPFALIALLLVVLHLVELFESFDGNT